jgi:PAS domain-containing protein
MKRTDMNQADNEQYSPENGSKMMAAELEHFASFPLLGPAPIIEMDSGGKVTFCNGAAEELLGKEACLDSSNPLIPVDLPDILRDLRRKKSRHFSRMAERSGSCP